MTVRKAYDRAIALINERDSSGEFHDDIKDFEKNAPELVNSAVTLLWLDECVIRQIKAKDFEWSFEPIKTMDDEIPLHDVLASGVLPYLLASMLLLEEDASRSEYFYKLFRDAKLSVMSSFSSAKHTSVKEVY